MSSTASSLSMMRLGSAKTDIVLTSVARMSPLRSRRSGRAPETASSAAPFKVCGGSCDTPSTTSFAPIAAYATNMPSAAVRMRAPERSSRVVRSARAKVFRFFAPAQLRMDARAAPPGAGSRSTPKFFGTARWKRAIAAAVAAPWRLVFLTAFGPGPAASAPSSHLTGGVSPPASAAGVALSFRNPSDSSVRPIESTLGWASGNSPTVAIWLSANASMPSFESASA